MMDTNKTTFVELDRMILEFIQSSTLTSLELVPMVEEMVMSHGWTYEAYEAAKLEALKAAAAARKNAATK